MKFVGNSKRMANILEVLLLLDFILISQGVYKLLKEVMRMGKREMIAFL